MKDPGTPARWEHFAVSERDRVQETSDGTHHMLSLLVHRPTFPGTREHRDRLISAFEALLLPGWIERGLPLVELSYGVSRPGATPFGAVLALQERDQGAAMVAEFGGEAVVVTLTDDLRRVAVPTKYARFR